ncbi:helix-turn-helix transcriptional regulator [Petroclostridium sp. X23]|uniref:helix-turn-helix transcriptional regulator n=1 Tax=Petroclostridium sp. X23 TaxID=3045146 RepID=UPI0024AD54DA|nr:helix-turn-helix transcriptional regulator [Petroclostridium sp. X23]WHH61268.1 helix-turn-helix transcriptional regulator [Petroclostridium sp. X23]
METIQREMNFLRAIMTLIAKQFGDRCEVVLHDWSKGYEKTIIAIENGHVTGRKVGDCGSNLGLEVLRGTSDGMNQFNYVTKTKTGKTLRSSSIYIKNEKGEPIGALCINYDISDILNMQSFIETLTMVNKDVDEHFVNNVAELLEYLICESIKSVGKPVEEMKKEDKIKALKYLDEKGAFHITKSGTKVCKVFNISKFTLYNYLDEFRREKNE